MLPGGKSRPWDGDREFARMPLSAPVLSLGEQWVTAADQVYGGDEVPPYSFWSRNVTVEARSKRQTWANLLQTFSHSLETSLSPGLAGLRRVRRVQFHFNLRGEPFAPFLFAPAQPSYNRRLPADPLSPARCWRRTR